MCGICGVFDFRGAPPEPALIKRMTGLLQHRGPDGEGFYFSQNVGMGHRRLSIIDIEGGVQPIANEDETIHVVFNGEIYNFLELRDELQKKGHYFKTRSDTEIIPHAYEEWGWQCVNHFNGIFAFSLWDAKARQLFLARDHLGVKPLYYVALNHRLLFASEIKALLADAECPKAVDVKALSKLFTLRYVPSPDTLFDHVKKLPPAHILLADSKGFRIKRYWTWKPQIRRHYLEGELIENYRALVEDAVRLQMRSDVPVGLFLSSGIDSGSLLALMRKHTNSPIHTFTIGFDDGERTNETDEARKLAHRFGTDHTEMILTPQDYQRYYERYLWDLEEPVGNETAAAFYFVSLIASRKVKVALTGQGADEPWAGYHRYLGVKLSQLYTLLPDFLTRRLIPRFVEGMTRNERLRRGAVSLHERDVLTRFIKIYSFYDSAMKARLFQPWMQQYISPNGYEAREALRNLHAEVADLDPLSQMLYLDTRTNLPDDLLMVADKTAMVNSLEARVPFLDYRIVQFIETLPPQLKLRGFRGKYLHKKACEKWLPKAIIYKKKKGFANPVDQWLRDRMHFYINECLVSRRAAVNQYFQSDYIKEIISKHVDSQQDYLRHIYLLISFELWHQRFISN